MHGEDRYGCIVIINVSFAVRIVSLFAHYQVIGLQPAVLARCARNREIAKP